jgi:hypothetical protein
MICAREQKAGRSTSGVYSSQLGRFVNSRSDVEKIAAEKGYGATGTGINVKLPELREVEKEYKVADDIVDEAVERVNQDEYDGRMTEQEKTDAFHETQERLSGEHHTYTALE